MSVSVKAIRPIHVSGSSISCANYAFIIAFAVMSMQPHSGQATRAGEPHWVDRSSETSVVSGAGHFLVSSSIPLDLPTLQAGGYERSGRSLNAIEIAQLASARSGAAQLVESDLQSRASSSTISKRRQDSYVSNRIQQSIGYRLRQVSVSNALKLHFAIAACIRAERVLDEAGRMLSDQSLAQSKLVEAGIPIPDPLFIDRAILGIEDKKITNRSQLTQLRAQLASSIGTEAGCKHSPIEDEAIVASDSDVCEHIYEALQCRCDLLTLTELQTHVSVETLAQWDSIGSSLSGVPIPMRGARPFWSRLFSSTCNKGDQAKAVAARKKWLCELIAERTKQVTLEVELAFEKKKNAALRWSIELESESNWDRRLRQLEALSEAHGNLADQTSAKLNKFESQGKLIERWLEWHQAEIELKLAKGCN